MNISKIRELWTIRFPFYDIDLLHVVEKLAGKLQASVLVLINSTVGLSLLPQAHSPLVKSKCYLHFPSATSPSTLLSSLHLASPVSPPHFLQSLLASLLRFFPSHRLLLLLLGSIPLPLFQRRDDLSRDGRLLVKSNFPPSLWLFLRNNEALVTTATVTALIAALGEVGLAKSALNLFYRMKQFHCKPDVQCYNTLISVLCQNRNFKKARFLLDQMELRGARCKANLYTYTIFTTFLLQEA